ncbi:hypothetical protein [Gilliamella apicola]|nr:hypothetical protein [Gilliamella apicola]
MQTAKEKEKEKEKKSLNDIFNKQSSSVSFLLIHNNNFIYDKPIMMINNN